jgi:UDP-N-acetylglucosamine 2-epimerase
LGAEKLLKSINVYNKSILNNKKIVKTKPIMWGKKITNNKIKTKKEFIFLHASTFKVLSQRNLIYENSFEYFENIINLSKAFAKISNAKLIILAKNLPECSYLTLKENLKNYKNVFVKSSGAGDRGSFIDYLKITDCLISYSSTTIEEAIYNNIPVGIINFSGENYIKFCPNEYKDSNSGIYELNLNNLIDKLKLIIKNHKKNKLKNEIIKNYFDLSNNIDVKFLSKNLLNF